MTDPTPAPLPDPGNNSQQLIYTFLLDLIKIAGACGVVIPAFLNQSVVWMIAGAIVTLISIVLTMIDKRHTVTRLQVAHAMNTKLANSLRDQENNHAA